MPALRLSAADRDLIFARTTLGQQVATRLRFGVVSGRFLQFDVGLDDLAELTVAVEKAAQQAKKPQIRRALNRIHHRLLRQTFPQNEREHLLGRRRLHFAEGLLAGEHAVAGELQVICGHGVLHPVQRLLVSGSEERKPAKSAFSHTDVTVAAYRPNALVEHHRMLPFAAEAVNH